MKHVIIHRDVKFHELSTPLDFIEPHVSLNLPKSYGWSYIYKSSSDVNVLYPSSTIHSTNPLKYFESDSVVPQNTNTLHIWEWEALEFVGLNVGTPSYTHWTRSNDPPNYVEAKGKPKLE